MKFIYLHLTQNCKNSFDLSSRRGLIGNPEASLKEFFLINPPE